MRGPFPRTMNRGVPPTARNARTGLSTPPTRLSWARAKSLSDLGAGGLVLARPISVSQGVEHRFRLRQDAGEDWGLLLRVLARLAGSKLHDQVEEIERMVRLEGEDELLIVQSEGVGGVDPDGRVAMADPDVVPHDLLPTLEGDRVPLPFLRERVDEEESAPDGRGPRRRALLPRVDVASDVLGPLARGQVRVGRVQVGTQVRRRNLAGHVSERLDVRVDRPDHEVDVRPDPLEGIAAKGDLVLQVVEE